MSHSRWGLFSVRLLTATKQPRLDARQAVDSSRAETRMRRVIVHDDGVKPVTLAPALHAPLRSRLLIVTTSLRCAGCAVAGFPIRAHSQGCRLYRPADRRRQRAAALAAKLTSAVSRTDMSTGWPRKCTVVPTAVYSPCQNSQACSQNA